MEELSNLHFGIAGLAIALVLFFFIKKMRSNRNEDPLPYTSKTAPNAQIQYDDKYKNPNPLTKDEKIELSWQFLYDITDIVLNKFSNEDKELVHQMGHKLVKNGGGYEHVVEYGLKKQAKKSRLVEEQEKDKNQEVSVKI